MNGLSARASSCSSSPSSPPVKLRPNAVAPLKQAGIQEFEQAPQVVEAVLDRRAAQRDPVLSAQHARGLRAGGVGVLDGLRFVENHVVEVHVGERHGIAAQGAVRDEHQVVLRDLVHPAGAIRTREIEHPQPRREAGRLLLPVEEHRTWHDHERRLPLSGPRPRTPVASRPAARARRPSCRAPCRRRGSRRIRTREETSASRAHRAGMGASVP